jgi:hypothetical protein
MLASRSHTAPASTRRSTIFCHPCLEPLEGRLLMAGLDVPQLSSRPGAAATIYLDFDGHVQASWGTFTNITSPAYDRDGNATWFNATELQSINDIWTRVSEDFAPFNINVTTVEPPSFADGVALRVVIGGSWADWYGTSANGVSLIGSFSNASPNVSYVFSKDIGGGFPKWVSEQVSHEIGHSLGLQHQSTWSGTVLQSELNSGSGDWAPIMGTGNFAARTTWYNGTTHDSPTTFQDDMAIIAGPTNGFGYVADDYPDTLPTAALLPISGSSVSLAGLIGQNGDQDVFKFTTAGGDLSFRLAGSRIGTNLDSVLELRDANGAVVTIANDTTSGVFSSTLSANVAAGTYYLIVRSSGGYGNVGQYNLTGTVVPGIVTSPEISILVGGVELTSGGGVAFGSTLVGTPVTQTFTVQNFGNGDLTLTPLDPAMMPAGFSIASSFGATTLAPGESTTFTLQLDATTDGTFSGTIHVLSNDADEGSFDIVLDGSVTTPIITAPEIRLWGNATELASGDCVTFGPTLIGTTVSRTFTIQNVGDGDLALSSLDPASLPPGFLLAQALGATTLRPTEMATFVVKFDAAAAGTFGGMIHVLSNDADESSFDIDLSGITTVPDIRVFVGAAQQTNGDTLDFGATAVGAPVTRTVTIQNVGDGDLTLSSMGAGSLPAGFTLVSDFALATVAPGETASFTIQLDASAGGTFGGTIYVLSNDADEGSFSIVLSGAVTAPEISVFAGTTELTTGGTVDFGTTQTGTPVTQTITVTNVGDAPLVLSLIDPGALPAGFSLVSNLSATTLAPGESATFTIRLDATTAGTPSGMIHLLSNDADESSFDVVLQATVNDPVPPPPPPTPVVQTIDNGAAGFTTTGRWHVQKNKGGFQRDMQFAEKAGRNNTKLATATWTFSDLPAGQYRVSITSPRSPSYAKDAPFSVFDGTTLLGTVLVNQKGAPLNFKKGRSDNVLWRELGAFTIQGPTLVVQLTNRASGHVVADGVRIERIATVDELLLLAPPPPAPALTPQQQSDIALEQSLLDTTNQLLDDLANDVALQGSTTSTATY